MTVKKDTLCGQNAEIFVLTHGGIYNNHSATSG